MRENSLILNEWHWKKETDKQKKVKNEHAYNGNTMVAVSYDLLLHVISWLSPYNIKSNGLSDHGTAIIV